MKYETPYTTPISDAAPAVTHTMPTLQQLAVALGMLVLIFGASYLPTQPTGTSEAQVPAPAAPPELLIEPEPREYFEDVSITARAAYVWDVREQRALYNKNAGVQLPLASLTKLMTALVAADELDANDPVRITAHAISTEGDSGFTEGEIFSRRSLTDFTLITSSNDGAYALAAAAGGTGTDNGEANTDAFISAMNAKAEEIGLTESYFANPTGLDISTTTSGSYGSARDMAFLMEHMLREYPELLEATREGEHIVYDSAGFHFSAENTNEVAVQIPGLIGSKTGYTDLAGGNLVIAFDAGLNRPVVISVLGSTRDGRFSDVMTLVQRTQAAFDTH